MANKSFSNVIINVDHLDLSKDASRSVLVTGENLSHSLGKIARWYKDISWSGHKHTESDISDFGTYAGSSTKGGAATSANKLNIGENDIGSETRPIYFSKTSGLPVECTYSLNASVPSSAVFTDSNVKQSPVSSNESREVLFAGSTGNNEKTEGVGKTTSLTFNPHTGALSATSFSGSLSATDLTGTINAARLPDSTVVSGSYGPVSGGALSHGGTFDVPYITVDKYGRLTASSTKTFTLPAQYVHPSHAGATSGLYKITVDTLGHVSATTAVSKTDITALGITYSDVGAAATDHAHDYVVIDSNSRHADRFDSGSSAEKMKTYLTTYLASNGVAGIFNSMGSEKLMFMGKSLNYGVILQAGYEDTYLRMLRYRGAEWASTDWEKISAGYADSAGNSDTVDGYHVSVSVVGNTVVARDANGYIYASYYNASCSEETPTSSSYIIYANSDGWFRKSSVANIKSILGLGSAAYTDSSAYASSSHDHDAGNITSGTLSNARLPYRLQEHHTTATALDTTVSGFYYHNDSSSPFKQYHNDNIDYMVIAQGYDSSWGSQIATDFRTNRLAVRNKNSGTWSSWAIVSVEGHTHSYLPLSGGLLEANNQWLSPARLQLMRPDTSEYTDRACIGVTNGNLHIDPYQNYATYLNYYNHGAIYFNGSNYYINSDGSYYNGSCSYASSAGNADTVDGYHAGSFCLTNDSRLSDSRQPVFYNYTWYAVGDDAAIGDHNIGGAFCVKGLNDSPKIVLFDSNDNQVGTVVHSGNIHNFSWSAYISYDYKTGTVTCSKGYDSWDAQFYSNYGYSTNCVVSFKATSTDGYKMIGLDSNPTEGASYDTIDYCWYLQHDGGLCIYESGTGISTGVPSSYVAGDEFKIEYVGDRIIYYKNGQRVRYVKRSGSGKLYLDSSFHNTGSIYDLEFKSSPITSETAYKVYMTSHPDTWYLDMDWDGSYFQTRAKYGNDTLPINVSRSDSCGTANYANSAGNADTLDNLHASAFALAHSHPYLPLSGGTMTGGITFSETSSGDSSGLCWFGSTDAIDMYYRVISSDEGALVINMRDDANVKTCFAYNGTIKSYIDTNGTYNGLASRAAAAHQLEAFTGDDFTGGNHFVKAIRSTDGWTTRLWMCYDGGAAQSNAVWVRGSDVSTVSGDGSIYMYANHSNEINFGGSNTSTEIYFGYRETDSRPIPTKFIFGGGGSANLTCGSITTGNILTSGIIVNGINNNAYAVTAGGGTWYINSGVSANSIVARDANGYIYASYYNASCGVETPTTSSYIIYANSDGWFRKMSLSSLDGIHSHGLGHYGFGAYVGDGSDTSFAGNNIPNDNVFVMRSLRSQASAPAWFIGDYSAGIAFGGADTKGVISCCYYTGTVRFAGGAGESPNWYFTISGDNGWTYNLTTLANNVHNHWSWSTGTDGENTVWSDFKVKEYDNAYPDGMSRKVYGWGGVLSIGQGNFRLELYANHNSTTWDQTSNGLQFRSGWADDKKSWRMLLDERNFYTIMGDHMRLHHDGSYYGMMSPGGDVGCWIRTTSSGIIPNQSGGYGSGHCYLGTESWYFAHAYIENIHGYLHGNADYASNTDMVDGYHASSFIFNSGINTTSTLQINPINDGNFNEGLRIGKHSNGWSNINLGCDNTTSAGTQTGQWIIASRGSGGEIAGGVGDFTIEHKGSNGSGLTLYADGSEPRWNGNIIVTTPRLSSALAGYVEKPSGGIQFMCAISGEHYQIAGPGGMVGIWIRTTTSGFIPSTSGNVYRSSGSSIGEDGWFFHRGFISNVYSRQAIMYSNNSKTITVVPADDISGSYVHKLPGASGTYGLVGNSSGWYGCPAAGTWDGSYSPGNVLKSNPSGMYTFVNADNGMWFAGISCRHRNGQSDGDSYGFCLYTLNMTGATNLTWNNQSAGSWYADRTIIDTGNWTSYVHHCECLWSGSVPVGGSGALQLSASFAGYHNIIITFWYSGDGSDVPAGHVTTRFAAVTDQWVSAVFATDPGGGPYNFGRTGTLAVHCNSSNNVITFNLKSTITVYAIYGIKIW